MGALHFTLKVVGKNTKTSHKTQHRFAQWPENHERQKCFWVNGVPNMNDLGAAKRPNIRKNLGSEGFEGSETPPPSAAGNSMTSSERPSPEPLLKKEAPPAVLGGRDFWKSSGSLKCL